MSEASRKREDEGYEARDDEVTPPRWPLFSWCNPSQDNEKSRPFWTGLFCAAAGILSLTAPANAAVSGITGTMFC